jgi:hypothetical protein
MPKRSPKPSVVTEPIKPVQAIGAAERPEGRLGRLALAAQRLARAQRQPSDAWIDELERAVPDA